MIDFATILEMIMLYVPKIVSWLITYSIHSTLLLAAVWLMTKLIQHRYPKIHDSLWKAALAGALLTTTFQMLSGVEPVAGRHTISANSEQPNNIVETLKQQKSFTDKLDALKATCDSLNIEKPYAISAAIEDTANLQWVSHRIATLLPGQLIESLNIDTSLIVACRTKVLTGINNDSGTNNALTTHEWVDDGTPVQSGSDKTENGYENPISPDAELQQIPAQGLIIQVHAESNEDADSLYQAMAPLAVSGMNHFNMGPDQQSLNYEFMINEITWFHWLILVWFIGIGICAIRYFESRRRLKILLADRVPVTHGPAVKMLNELCQTSGVKRKIHLTCSSKINGPIANGFKEICLPKRALTDLNAEQLHSMLAHEMAHIVRYDPLWLIFTAILDILFFFQPLNRMGRRQLQETAEYLCDDWAVQHTGESLNLAKCLAQVAKWVQSKPQHVYVAGMASGGSALRRRVTRILDHQPEKQPSLKNASLKSGRWIVILAMCLLLLTAASAPIVSAEYVKANMYVMYLNDVSIDNFNINNKQDAQVDANRKLTLKIKKSKFAGDFTKQAIRP